MNQVVIFGIMLATVIVGNLLARHVPQIPLPFFLIGLGAALAIMPSLRSFTIDPSAFSFAIIAPLLFNEGQNASRGQIGRSLTNIVSLAVGLVIVSVVILGFGVHALFPVIPLSLAFALIAIVTPTDASAVSAVAQANPLSTSQMQLLNNESLFNDAAGIVAFDLALSAYISGQFSATDALLDFLFVFFGGILFGALAGIFIVNLRAWLIRIGDDEPLIMVGIQLLTPLLVYFLAEELALSGILAVVAAGIAQGVERDRLRLTSARMQIISANVWEMIAAVLSGLVFVLLGVSLPNVVIEALRGQAGLFGLLIGIGAFIYVAKSFVRFIWSRTLLKMGKKHRWRNALIMMLGGANEPSLYRWLFRFRKQLPVTILPCAKDSFSLRLLRFSSVSSFRSSYCRFAFLNRQNAIANLSGYGGCWRRALMRCAMRPNITVKHKLSPMP